MEHLFFRPSDERCRIEISSAAFCDVLERDWETLAKSTDLIPHISPTTRWLGFEHHGADGNTLTPVQRELDMYAKIRGWDFEKVWDTGNLRFAHESLRSEDVSAKEVVSSVAKMVQSWLYFGLFEAILGKWVDTTYLVRQDEQGIPLLYSRNIGMGLYAWMVKVKRLEPAEKREELARAGRNLMAAGSCIQSLFSLTPIIEEIRVERSFPGYTDAMMEILPAIIRLTDAISITRDRMIADSDVRMVTISSPQKAPYIFDRSWRLQQRGWCPFLIRFCLNVFHDSVLDWLDGSGKENPSGGHETCTEQECVRNNIDPADYEMRHSQSGCSCELLKPTLADVIGVIDSDEIPVMNLIDDKTGPRLEVSSRSPRENGDYIAISHVWVDGLGSTTEVGIYRCQVQRLAGLVKQVTGRADTPFWIDSLCIPDTNPYRKRSIGMLRNVYLNAAKVLVIDKTIGRCNSNSDVEDILWAITSSPWLQRLWTYQESYLAREVVFAFEDTIFPFDFDKLPISKLPAPVQVVWTSFIYVLGNLRPDITRLTDRRTNLGEVMTAVNWRTTSRSGDETLAVAALLAVDGYKLANLPEDKRVQELLLMVRKIPHDIIFFDGPKMTEFPFRWAPRTLMVRSENVIASSTLEQSSVCDADGLHGTYYFLLLDERLRGVDGATIVPSRTDKSVYGIVWSTESEIIFDMIIVRTLETSRYLIPEVGGRVETIAACSRRSESEPKSLTCDYVGSVVIMKLSNDLNFEREIPVFRRASRINGEWRLQELRMT